MAVGMLVLLLTVRASTVALVPGLLLAGLGMGLVAPTLVDVALAEVETRDAGSASGVVATAGQLGGALGVAILGLVFFGALPSSGAGAQDYSAAFSAALYYEIAVFLLAALLMPLLPKAASTGSRAVVRPGRTDLRGNG